MARIRNAALAAIIGAIAATATVNLTGSSEGVSLTPYTDTIGSEVETVCYGETNVPMHRYTLQACKDMLSTELSLNLVYAA